MTMHSDSHFYIGKTHKVCQDYALSGANDTTKLPFAIVSDGCSSSSLTDLGARLLAIKTAAYLSGSSAEGIPDWVIHSLAASVRSIPVPEEALDATLMFVQALPNNKYIVFCQGDGVIARVTSAGIIHATEIEFVSDAPLYMSYLLNPQRYAKYKETFGTKRVITHYHISKTCCKVTAIEEREGPDPYVEIEAMHDDEYNDYNIIAVMSDGALSFTKLTQNESSKVRDVVPLTDVLKDMLNFKTFSGEFVVRRLERFRKEFAATNEDDVSMGAIYTL